MSDFASLVDSFTKIRPIYEAYSIAMETLLKSLLAAEEIEYFSIETRTKSIESFSGKISREEKNGKYKKTTDVTDLCGIRIIAYLQKDCDKICEIIRQNFNIDEINSIVKEDELPPDKFGYLSTHYVISLSEDRAQLPEFVRFKDLKAEIQVRTLLQHTWAAIDWKFRYKEEKEAPRSLRRRLFRISALLEAADNEFSSVKSELDRLNQEYSDRIEKGDLDIPINVESLKSYVIKSKTAEKILNAAKEGGISVVATNTEEVSILYSRLAGTCEIMGLKTLENLDDTLKKSLKDAKEFYKFLVSKTDEHRMKENKETATLKRAAIIRYTIVRFASPAKQRTISSEYAFAPGYFNAIVEYASS